MTLSQVAWVELWFHGVNWKNWENIVWESIYELCMNTDTKNQSTADLIVAGNIEPAGLKDEQIFEDVI